MAQTVIGFFDNSSEAQTAVQELVSSGISRDRIDISSGNTGASTTGHSSSASSDRDNDSENGITRFFKNLFGGDDDDEADRYSRVASSTNSIVTVHAQSREEAEMAASVLDESGAVDVDERAAQAGYTGTSRTEGMTERANISGERDTTIERIEEDLEVGKRTVETGGVRLRSRIVERPVEEHVRLREETVNVERNAVNRPVSSDDLANFKEQNIELTEHAEVPVVNKEARVVEEIRVSKDVTERDETIRDNVRHTEVDIDNLNKDKTRDDLDSSSSRSGF
jgi:stress response protein YsnF